MRTLLLLFAVGALFCCVSHAGSAGREFILSFLLNYGVDNKAQLQLFITAVQDHAKVVVKTSSFKFQEMKTLGLGETFTVSVPSACELHTRNRCTVIVSSSADVTITALNYKHRTADTTLVYPITELGTEYYVMTPSRLKNKEFSVTNGRDSNKVTISGKWTLYVNNKSYQPGSTLVLKPYESVLFLSNNDLTGTKVTSERPVAVFTGHACTVVSQKFCNHVYEQLLPVNKWGSTFVVPAVPVQSKDDFVYVMASQRTQINVNQGKTYSLNINAGQVKELRVSTKSPLYLQADHGIQVLMMFSGAKRGSTTYDSFLITILSTDQSCFDYSLRSLKDFDNEALVVAPKRAVPKLRLDGVPLSRNIKWSSVPGTEYEWAQIDCNNKKVLSSSDIPFGMYSFGLREANAYGSAGQCVKPGGTEEPLSSSTCWAMGDPHYKTFDGQRFDFMGTCTYVISKNCKADDKLQGFEVLAENENRGNRRVSYVSVVTVKAYGTTITVVRSEKGRVRIDDILWSLPVALDGNKLLLSQSGHSVLIETDFGLTVRYDWNSRLLVSLTKNYAGKTCGLCGNFNGNPKDDFATPSGTQANGPVAFGTSWKVQGMGTNAQCSDDCVGGCGSCENKKMKQWEGDGFCGMIAQKNGPFGKCHSTIDSQVYLENCKYDVCMAQGNRYFLCKALEDYAEVCQTSGIQVQDWRKKSKCYIKCPANSHYEACGSACPATCTNPDAPSKCKQPCVETCTCNKGFVLSGNRCVRTNNCGCTHENRYIPAGQSFWADNSCQRWCKCNPRSRKVECRNKRCRAGEQCKVIKGVRKCHASSTSTCHATGDPHYLTFDKQKFDFQGTCVYQLAALCTNDTELEHFEVRVQNEHRHNKRVSYTKLVAVKVDEFSIIITARYKGSILVNNKLVNLPVSLDEGRIYVQNRGFRAVVTTTFGLKVTFDWRSRATVTLPDTYKEAVCGLCGNFNGKKADDLIPKNGDKSVSPTDFGNSWQVDTIPGCDGGCKGSCPKCDINQKIQYGQKNFCGIIKDPSGPFRECHAKVSPDEYFEDCVFDVCLYKGKKDVLCQAVEAYTDACQSEGVKLYNWRTSQFCAMKCPVHSHYELCPNGSPASCMGLITPEPYDSKCKEGCICNEGYILSGGVCVPQSQCGCFYDNNYYRVGQVFYPSGQCQERCMCKQDGEVECKDVKCGPNEECKIVKGIQKCHPVGKGVCQAAGDPHYTSFDGRKFDFQGTCTYILSKSCGIEGTDLVDFVIKVENVRWERNKRKVVSVTKLVVVEVYGFTIIMKHKMSGILVNGELNSLPLNLNDGAVNIYKRGRRYVIETDFGLIVRYDLVYHVTVTVPGNYQGKVCGLCGNFNGNKKDDFKNPRGANVNNVNSFGTSWKVTIPGVSCENGCVGKNCPNCEAPRKALFSKFNYCGIMTAAKSPFKICHAKVDPQTFFDDCVFDVCASNGQGSVLCDSIAAYAFRCYQEGVVINNWRTKSFCPMKCPANSHYEVCADNWGLACPGLTGIVPAVDRCTEGCECDDSFSFDGETCIKDNECGCFDNGKSYKPGAVVYENNCETKCTCKPDKGLVCEEHSCPQKTKCMVRKGIRACYHTDPCEDANCRVKEKCSVVKGEAKCVPIYTGTCWAWGDPHYHTFDGYNFDFQGTCKYVVSETCGDLDGLVPFSITEKNDNRGKKAVSYVRDVHVSVYGYTITIRKNEVGRITVDGELLNLPVELGDGKVSLFQRGGRAVVETNFGLVVTYEWKWHLVIKLPSSYHGSVCGLCGNFNGIRGDDRKDPAGKPVSSVIQWGKSWQTPDQDKVSPCYVCEEDCPSCPDKQRLRYESESFCGALTAKNGVFKTCHKTVDPQPFFHSCVYDTCLNDGDKKLLCLALASYTSQCKDKGVKIKGWRKKHGCPMNCPRHSQYKECASSCQPSCPFPDEPQTCTRECVESCVCDRGYALSGGACVLKNTCGCSYEGRYYKPGQRFWADDACGRLCDCDTTLGMVKCRDASCSPKEVCALVDGERTCVATGSATCSASGDPHYLSFDRNKFDFQGTCTYLLVGLCSRQEGLEPFNVTVQNDHRGSTSVSFTKIVNLDIYGITITLSRQFPNRILVNDELTSLPLEFSDKLKVFRSGRRALVKTAAGITVTFNWRSTVRVTVPSTYQDAVCGLCGNYNGKRQDDMAMPNGQTATNSNAFGESWQVGATPGCSTGCKGPKCQDCSDKQKSKYVGSGFCGVIADKAGPFKNCHKKLDPGTYLADCVFDACQYHGHFGAICDAVQTYASACQSEGITVDAWRRGDFCPMECPANSHYTLCASACPPTCSSVTSVTACRQACVEGCECDDGYLLSGDTCVPVKDCGCSYDGRYYKKGDVFYPDSKCEEKCVCGETGDISCQKNKCPRGETCKLLNGLNGCHPVKTDKCVASGDPHYRTFDGKRFDFQGTCTYVLAKTCNLGETFLTPFTVTQGNQRYGNGRVSVTKTISVQVFDYDITMKQGLSWKVLLNNEFVNLPLSLANGVQVTQQGQNIIVQTDFGLKVLYNTVYYVEVIVPSTYQQKMCGLCGNNNNKPRDDFKLPKGMSTNNVDHFGKMWAVDKDADQCGGCGKKCPSCPRAKENLYRKPESCGIISNPKGPFKACHSKVDPKPYLSDCVFDVCVTDGSKDTLCNSIMAYALACQSEGVQIQPWRSKSTCPVSCPSNSHYELSGSSCDRTCASFIGQLACSERNVEGCQCDPGFVFDSDKCVPLDKCGCIYKGRYLRVGESVICSRCKSNCMCKASGVMSCQQMSCASGEDCIIRDGSRGCFAKQRKCSIGGRGQLTSFDGMSGVIKARAAFELASLCDESNEQWFRVVVDTRVCTKAAFSNVAVLYVFYKDTTVAVNSRQTTWVNGKRESLSTKRTNELSIQLSEGSVVIDITPSVRVTFSKSLEVTVIVDGSLTNKLCGVCGNSNDDAKDDMLTANGKTTSNVADIVASWSAGDFSRCI